MVQVETGLAYMKNAKSKSLALITWHIFYLFIFIMVMDKNSGIFFYLGYKGEAQSGDLLAGREHGCQLSHRLIGNSCGTLIVH